MRILPEEPGSDLTIISCMYYEQFKYKGEYKDDVYMVVYRDEKDEKKVEFIPRPEVEIYFSKKEHRQHITPRMYVPKEHVYSVKCRYAYILSAIEKQLKDDDSNVGKNFKRIARSARDTNNYRLKKELHKYPYVFFSDVDIDSRYRMEMMKEYNTADRMKHSIRMSFMDIESLMYKEDGTRYTDHELNMDLNPINMISYATLFNPKTQELDGTIHMYTFAVKDKIYGKKQRDLFSDMKKIEERAIKYIKDIDITVKGKTKNFLKESGFKFKLKTITFDTEIEMLLYFWKLAHASNPDTMAVWNIGYDIPRMHARLQMNGYDPVEIMSHPHFPEGIRFVDMHIDKRPGMEMANRNTYISMTNTIEFVDQMILYAQVNKGRKDYGTNGLDNIALVEAGIQKLKFSQPGVDVLNAPLLAYDEFFIYSIVDVVIQIVIEFMTTHIDNMYFEINSTATSPNKIHKLNTYLRNVYYSFYEEQGYVPGNNKNTDYTKDISADDIVIKNLEEELERMVEDKEITEEEKMAMILEIVENDFKDNPFKKHELKAGLVADPNLNLPVGAELIKGVRSSHIFPLSMDADYTAHYPTSTIVMNISDPTQFGRLVIYDRISKRQNVHNEVKYVPGGEYMVDYISGNKTHIGNVWHGLGHVEDLVAELDRRLN